MTPWATLIVLLTAGTGASAGPGHAAPDQYAQIIIREQIMIRMPVPKRGKANGHGEWKEKRGPRCIDAKAIASATLAGPKSVDLVLKDRSRVRARLEKSCPALDFYDGFYISRNSDGRICADRDTIRSRIGGQCEIDRFRGLKEVRRK